MAYFAMLLAKLLSLSGVGGLLFGLFGRFGLSASVWIALGLGLADELLLLAISGRMTLVGALLAVVASLIGIALGRAIRALISA